MRILREIAILSFCAAMGVLFGAGLGCLIIGWPSGT